MNLNRPESSDIGPLPEAAAPSAGLLGAAELMALVNDLEASSHPADADVLLDPMVLVPRSDLLKLAEDMERAAAGTEVWRVADSEGAYCIEFSRADSIDPQRECQRWYDEHRAYCLSRGHSVQQARTFTQSEHTARQVAERLREIAGAVAPGVQA